MSRRPGVDHNNNLYKAAGLDHAEALLEKALSYGLVLEEDPYTGHVYFVDRIAPAYQRDWFDERFGSDRGTAAHNAAFNGNFNALIYLLNYNIINVMVRNKLMMEQLMILSCEK